MRLVYCHGGVHPKDSFLSILAVRGHFYEVREGDEGNVVQVFPLAGPSGIPVFAPRRWLTEVQGGP
jgi:hypothetical protein